MATSSFDFYATPGRHTDISRLGVDAATIEKAVGIVQGVLVYDLVATDFYGVDLAPAQAGTVHERDAAAILEVARRIDERPLDVPRQPAARVGGRCNMYTLLTVSLLRAAGIPARSRCGFATYFVPGIGLSCSLE